MAISLLQCLQIVVKDIGSIKKYLVSALSIHLIPHILNDWYATLTGFINEINCVHNVGGSNYL